MRKKLDFECNEDEAKELFKKGDYPALVAYLQPIVEGIVYKAMTNSYLWSEMEDVVNNVNLKLLRNIHNYNPDLAPLRSYVAQAAMYSVYDLAASSHHKRDAYTSQLDENLHDTPDPYEVHVEVEDRLATVQRIRKGLNRVKDTLTPAEIKAGLAILDLLESGYEYSTQTDLMEVAKVGQRTLVNLYEKLRKQDQ